MEKFSKKYFEVNHIKTPTRKSSKKETEIRFFHNRIWMEYHIRKLIRKLLTNGKSSRFHDK